MQFKEQTNSLSVSWPSFLSSAGGSKEINNSVSWRKEHADLQGKDAADAGMSIAVLLIRSKTESSWTSLCHKQFRIGIPK